MMQLLRTLVTTAVSHFFSMSLDGSGKTMGVPMLTSLEILQGKDTSLIQSIQKLMTGTGTSSRQQLQPTSRTARVLGRAYLYRLLDISLGPFLLLLQSFSSSLCFKVQGGPHAALLCPSASKGSCLIKFLNTNI